MTDSGNYFYKIEKAFWPHNSDRVVLTNAGFSITSPYGLTEGWVAHDNLCTACEVLTNLGLEYYEIVDHISDHEYMARAASYGCYFCACNLESLRVWFDEDDTGIQYAFPITVFVCHDFLAFGDARRAWNSSFEILTNRGAQDYCMEQRLYNFGAKPQMVEQIRS